MPLSLLPDCRRNASRLIWFVWLCCILSVPVSAQIVIEGVDSTGARIQRRFSEGTAVNVVSRRDTILAIHSVDLNEVVSIIVELEAPPLAFVRSEQSTALGKQQAAIAALARIEMQQADVLAEIQRAEAVVRGRTSSFKTASTVPRFTFTTALNGLVFSTRRWLVGEIGTISGVRNVYADRIVQATGEVSARVVAPPDDLWQRLGATGKGIVISIIDTGIDYTHPALGGGIGPGYKVIGGYDFINNDSNPKDDNGHGTHVAGIAAGNDPPFIGMAPDARLLAFKVLGMGGSGSISLVIAGIERSLDPDQNPATDDAADVINMSLTAPGTPDGPLARAVDNAVRSGIVCVVAAGNDGWGERYETIGSPGVAREAITVGAVDASKAIAPFSSRGPSPTLYAIKPDLLAPGVDINSAALGGGYVHYSGTSMASPYVAGAVALLKELHPNWTPAMIKTALMLSADDTGNDVWTQGSGYIDVFGATEIGTLVQPASLSPGLVDAQQAVWTWTGMLHMTNLRQASATFAFSLGALPAGVSATVTPAQVALAPGVETDVTFTLRVDNQVLPFSDDTSPGHMSHVYAISATDTLAIPFAFIKSHSLELTFSDEPWLVYLYNDEGDYWLYPYPGGYLKKLLPKGRYNLTIQYTDVYSSTVLREGVEVQGNTRLSIGKEEAQHTIVMAGVAYDGTPLPLNNFVRSLAHKSGITTITSTSWFGYVDQIESKISSLSADYTYNVRSDHFALPSGVVQTFHEGPRGHFIGLNGSVTLHNDPADVSAIDYEYTTDPGTSEIFVIDKTCDRGLCAWTTDTSSASPNRLTAPFKRRIYLLAGNDGPSVYQQEVYRTDAVHPPEQEETHLYSLASVRLDREQLWFFREFDLKNPVYTLARSPEIRLAIGSPLLRWAGRTYHWGGDKVRIGGIKRSGAGQAFGYFLDPLGTIRLTQFSYRLKQNGSVVAEGALRNRMIGSNYDVITAPSGRYQLELEFGDYQVEGLSGTARVELGFDTANWTDSNPPYLTKFALLSDGQLAGSISRSAENEILLAAEDDQQVRNLALRYRPSSQSGWVNLPLDLVDALYGAKLPYTLGSGYHDLEVTAEDASGNTLRYDLSPAFYVYGLAAPVVSSPPPMADPVSLTPNLAWIPVSGAIRYHLQVATDSIFATNVFDDSLLVATTQTLGALTPTTKYYWRVRALDALSAGLWSDVRSFTTIVALPGAPTLTQPADHADDQPSRPLLSWEPLASAEQYHAQVATDVDFTQLVLEDSTLTTASYTTDLLSYRTTYFWRVRARNVAGTGFWSQVRAFTTIMQSPAQVLLAMPANDSPDEPTALVFGWNEATRAESYQFQLTTRADFATASRDSTFAGLSLRLVDLSNTTRYYWRVRAHNGGGTGLWSDVRSFTTIVERPAAPTLSQPADNAVDLPSRPSLSWEPLASSEQYHVQVAQHSDFAQLVLEDSTLSTPSWSPDLLSYSTTYFWRVRARNVAGTGSWSQVRAFTTIMQSPAQVFLSTPANDSPDEPTTLVFGWNEAARAESYLFQLTTHTDFATASRNSTLAGLSLRLEDLLNATRYYWRIRAHNGGGTGLWSNVRSFTTIVARPAAPTLSQPADNADDQPSRPMLSWEPLASAEQFHTQVATDVDFTQLVLEDSTLTTASYTPDLLSYSTTYFWRVRARNRAGASPWSATRRFTVAVGISIERFDMEIPQTYTLYQNYPNPFNNGTTLSFDLPEGVSVSLTVYDALGRTVALLVTGHLPAGRYRYLWDATSLPSGIYLYQLKAKGFIRTHKLLILK